MLLLMSILSIPHGDRAVPQGWPGSPGRRALPSWAKLGFETKNYVLQKVQGSHGQGLEFRIPMLIIIKAIGNSYRDPGCISHLTE